MADWGHRGQAWEGQISVRGVGGRDQRKGQHGSSHTVQQGHAKAAKLASDWVSTSSGKMKIMQHILGQSFPTPVLECPQQYTFYCSPGQSHLILLVN